MNTVVLEDGQQLFLYSNKETNLILNYSSLEFILARPDGSKNSITRQWPHGISICSFKDEKSKETTPLKKPGWSAPSTPRESKEPEIPEETSPCPEKLPSLKTHLSRYEGLGSAFHILIESTAFFQFGKEALENFFADVDKTVNFMDIKDPSTLSQLKSEKFTRKQITDWANTLDNKLHLIIKFTDFTDTCSFGPLVGFENVFITSVSLSRFIHSGPNYLYAQCRGRAGSLIDILHDHQF